MMVATKPRILLVEDHAATANALRRYLQIIGYDVLTAPNARCAREIAATEPFDILIADINLPDGNGWNLMRKLRAQRQIAGIAISGFGSPADVKRSEAAGFATHLVKPLSPDELTSVLEALSGALP